MSTTKLTPVQAAWMACVEVSGDPAAFAAAYAVFVRAVRARRRASRKAARRRGHRGS